MSLPIDLDSETVLFDGHWYTRDELAQRIKGQLDSGDFAVTRPSQALEQLNQTVSTVRTLAFRSTPELADAINAAAAQAGKTVGGVIREALSAYLAGATSPQPQAGGAPVAEPGPAKAAAPEPTLDSDGAVELTKPKKKEEDVSERRWFNS